MEQKRDIQYNISNQNKCIISNYIKIQNKEQKQSQKLQQTSKKLRKKKIRNCDIFQGQLIKEAFLQNTKTRLESVKVELNHQMKQQKNHTQKNLLKVSQKLQKSQKETIMQENNKDIIKSNKQVKNNSALEENKSLQIKNFHQIQSDYEEENEEEDRNQSFARKIPSNLYQSFDELKLSVSADTKPNKKTKKLSKQNNQNVLNRNQSSFNEQLFAQLPIIENYFIIKINDKFHQNPKKLILLKNNIFYENTKIPIQTITKIKIQKLNQQIQIKINSSLPQKQKDNIMVIKIIPTSEIQQIQSAFQVFSEIVFRKLLLNNILINFSNQNVQKQQNIVYQAELYKKAHIFGSWEKRKVKLFQQTLQFFKGCNLTDQIFKFFELWTRFDMINGYLVVKIWHKLQKIQIGIPLCNFTDKFDKNNWLYGLYRLMINSKV